MPAVQISEDVARAVAAGQPVLALESTIFTHGLPRPRNVEVALAAEEQLRQAGVVPATIGIVGGVATVGLTTDQIVHLSANDTCAKVSVRDLPMAHVRHLDGGTTVAATAFLAYRAGIRVFSTGGLGGVHHGASATFDESADLPVLARTPVLVVSAGVKSILDIAASLERLETLSIPVVGFRTKAFPGFYLADSGHAVEYSVETAEEAAELMRARDAYGVEAAILVANPVPGTEQLDPSEHSRVLAAAWEASRSAGILGHDSTPFLLDYIQRATNGRSLDVNVAVYRNNVSLGARIASAHAAAGAVPMGRA